MGICRCCGSCSDVCLNDGCPETFQRDPSFPLRSLIEKRFRAT